MKKLVSFFIAATFVLNLAAQQTGIFEDDRDGKTYKTVKIGDQIWLAENIAYEPISDNYWASENKQITVATCGYLYNWQTTKKVCPIGWHVPSKKEWQTLIRIVGKYNGSKLCASSYENGTDDFGFSALPCTGEYSSYNSKWVASAKWWSSTEKSQTSVFYMYPSCNSPWDTFKDVRMNVRCIKD